MQDEKGRIGDATTLQVGYRLKCGMANEAQVDKVMHEREARPRCGRGYSAGGGS